MQHRIVVKRHRPWFWTGMVAVASALIAIAGVMLYQWARAHTIDEFDQTRTDLEQSRDERRNLTRQLHAEQAQNLALRAQSVYTQRSGEIDDAACTQVKASLADLQAEAADLREQVAFYRGIVSPSETRAGVRVLDLKISALPGARQWHFDLVLIQSVRHDKRVAGTTRMRLIGSSQGKEVQQDLAPLLTGDSRLPPFAFKYFQEFSGEFTLPEMFQPLRAVVTLDIDGGEPPVENEFDWSKIQVERPPDPPEPRTSNK